MYLLHQVCTHQEPDQANQVSRQITFNPRLITEQRPRHRSPPEKAHAATSPPHPQPAPTSPSTGCLTAGHGSSRARRQRPSQAHRGAAPPASGPERALPVHLGRQAHAGGAEPAPLRRRLRPGGQERRDDPARSLCSEATGGAAPLNPPSAGLPARRAKGATPLVTAPPSHWSPGGTARPASRFS